MMPIIDQQWQEAVYATHALLTLETARLYDLVAGAGSERRVLC
jgi:hypothetical protein